jgi:hypothetical protein
MPNVTFRVAFGIFHAVECRFLFVLPIKMPVNTEGVMSHCKLMLLVKAGF